jgi:hypothetical protein
MKEHISLASTTDPVFDGPHVSGPDEPSSMAPKKETYPPSMLERKAICPGYKRDDTGDETYAEQGRLCHKAVETADLTPIPDELKNAVQKCIDFKQNAIASYGAQIGIQIMSEVKLPYLDQHGYADVLIINLPAKEAQVIDWKFANNFYPADSPQFHAYCVAIWDKYPVDDIMVTVVHPFFAENEVDGQAFMRSRDYDKFYAEIAAIIARGRKNDPADYRISAQCAFCGFAGQCSKLAALGIEVAQRYATELELPEGSLHGSDVTNPEKMGQLLDLRAIITQAVSGWGQAGMAMLHGGKDIPGYEIGHRNGRRGIGSAAAAWKLIKEEFVPGIEPEDFLEHCTATATGLDKLISDATPTGQKAKRITMLKCRMEDEDILTSGVGSDFVRKVRKQ